MERAAEPPRERADDHASTEVEVGAARSDALRCPYCREHLPDGAGAAACAACDTLHHAQCFAEHRGCATHACGSTRARSVVVGAVPPLDFPGLSCFACKRPFEADAIVARCGCGALFHVGCREGLQAPCPAGCLQRGDVELLPHADAAAHRLTRMGNALLLTGAVPAMVLALALATGIQPPAPVFAVFGIVATIVLLLGWRERERAARIAGSPRGPRRAGAHQPKAEQEPA